MRRERLITDDDADGAVSFDFASPVPLRTILAAVDLTTGDYIIATPQGYNPAKLPDPADSPRLRVARRNLQAMDLDLRFVEALYVQPGRGAWGLTAGDGADGDEDHQANGVLLTTLGRLRSIGVAAVPPVAFLPGDVVVLIDPLSMEYFAIRLAKGQR